MVNHQETSTASRVKGLAQIVVYLNAFRTNQTASPSSVSRPGMHSLDEKEDTLHEGGRDAN